MSLDLIVMTTKLAVAERTYRLVLEGELDLDAMLVRCTRGAEEGLLEALQEDLALLKGEYTHREFMHRLMHAINLKGNRGIRPSIGDGSPPLYVVVSNLILQSLLGNIWDAWSMVKPSGDLKIVIS